MSMSISKSSSSSSSSSSGSGKQRRLSRAGGAPPDLDLLTFGSSLDHSNSKENQANNTTTTTTNNNNISRSSISRGEGGGGGGVNLNSVNIFADVFTDVDDLIWPLQLIDTGDKEQFSVLYPLLSTLPHAVMFYLNELIFPEVLAHQGLKLSTCGQELGGDILFGRRIGFSGTLVEEGVHASEHAHISSRPGICQGDMPCMVFTSSPVCMFLCLAYFS